jgi:hypothetical protein
MGLFDTLELRSEHDLPGFDGDPTEIEWQTKSIKRADTTTFRITDSGHLEMEEWHLEEVPEEERPEYDEEIGGFESDLDKSLGSLQEVHEGWTTVEYHGEIEFHAAIDDELRSFTAKFTDGELVEFRAGEPEFY